MNDLIKNRKFQLWQYDVSHGRLLLRSPRHESDDTNVDIKFFGVQYISLPRHLGKVKVSLSKNKSALISLIGRKLDNENVYEINSNGKIFIVVALQMEIDSNEQDIFESPFLS